MRRLRGRLTRRTRAEEAVAVGLELLARLGMPFPAEEQAPTVVGCGIPIRWRTEPKVCE